VAEFKVSFPEGEVGREIALRGLSQKEFAAKAGLSKNTISKAIRGERLMPRTFGRILIALGMPIPDQPTALLEKKSA
jgi:transcriptional regulator with XRE-family HTH domain